MAVVRKGPKTVILPTGEVIDVGNPDQRIEVGVWPPAPPPLLSPEALQKREQRAEKWRKRMESMNAALKYSEENPPLGSIEKWFERFDQ